MFFKKQGAGFYFSVLSVLVGIAAVILYVVNSGHSYFDTGTLNSLIVFLSVLAIGLEVVVIVGSEFKRANKIDDIVIDVLIIAVIALMTLAFMFFVNDRVYSIAIVLGSDLEAGNTSATEAIYQAIVGFVLYAVSIIFGIVAAFFNIRKPVQKA